ncbi:hypothetical protein QKU48_gp0873 [Fadolivirus algeromassiliense]|uniref:Uncharacterized protein n=1 Tax=Fadolivirus FV1/VV64 TaxID=3070911 RepID=A0A7D3UUS2_9VIRU|nr:hypothetical protein QKU48_gp0873 [Fadolivirus algeromassiliense]QKF94331.1 hypothetical protein Fadolivirus_1_873 [Fadolivirus FV1/VV64]
MNLYILGLIVMIIFCIVYNQYKLEPFQDLNIYAMRLFGAAKHVRLNKFNRIESIHIQPPLPKTGESRCDKVVCPQWVPDNAICYKCI